MKLSSLFNFPYAYTRLDGKGGLVSQFFGERPEYYRAKYGVEGHNGIDLAVPDGTTLIAPAGMEIMEVGENHKTKGTYIIAMIVENEEIYYMIRFLHLQKYLVKIGQIISENEIIGTTNNSGNSSGPHLHIDIRKYQEIGVAKILLNANNGYAGFLDPLDFINTNNSTKQMKLKLKRINGQIDVYAIGPDGKKHLILNSPTFLAGEKMGLWGKSADIEVVNAIPEKEGEVIIIAQND